MANALLKIGNAQGFWGDRVDAAAELACGQEDLDYLTLDYLAEVSMSILARQRQRDPALGYARDFVDALRLLAPHWLVRRKSAGHRLRLITNAGGLNPRGCAEACIQTLREAGLTGMRIGVVSGDDVTDTLRQACSPNNNSGNGNSPSNAAPGARNPGNPAQGRNEFVHLETDRPLNDIQETLTTANAYLGAAPLVEALEAEADLVIAGRVADPSMAVAPCVHHLGWSEDQFDRLAGATVAGHLIECGTQVTGGVSTDWLDLPSVEKIGFPVVEVDTQGNVVVTKPPGTGGRVNEQTVKEQLLYELGDPGCYLSPDATVSFLSLQVDDLGNDRVRVAGATGSAPPSTYKVSATYRAGYRATGELTLYGRNTRAKAERCGEVILAQLRAAGCDPERSLVETFVGQAYSPVVVPDGLEATLFRIGVADPRRAVIERFSRAIMPLITAGPQGITGYAQGRPRVQEVFGYWPCLIDRHQVQPHVEILEV